METTKHTKHTNRGPLTGSLRTLVLFLAVAGASQGSVADDLGLFTDQGDVGLVRRAGAGTFDPSGNVYLITGGGANMWGTNDAFHFVWRQARGDFDLAADIEWIGAGGNAHRKACLMIRSGTATDAAYVDAALHGDGLTSLQFRETTGGATHEVQAPVRAPRRLRLERRGEFVTLSTGAALDPLEASGCAFKLRLADPVFVGLAVCAHDDNALERARFSNVSFTPITGSSAGPVRLRHVLEIVPIGSKDRRVLWHSLSPLAEPRWSEDGKFVSFVEGSRGWLRVAATGGKAEPIQAEIAQRKSDPRAISFPSPDGRWLVSLAGERGVGSLEHSTDVRLRILPLSGGAAQTLATLWGDVGSLDVAPWSPDSREVVFISRRLVPAPAPSAVQK